MVSTGLRGGGSRVDDRVVGVLMLVAGVAGLGVYFWLVFLAPSAWAWLTIQVSAVAAVGAMLLIVAWIGYTLATTPSPVPLEEFEEEPSTDDEGDKP